MAEGIRLTGREYKLLLAESEFRGPPTAELAGRIWDQVKTIVDGELGTTNGESRAQGELKLDKQRLVRFWDAAGCPLAKRKFSLRQRQKLVDPGDVELTLKYRSVDLFTAVHQLSRVADAEDVQFEEDIGPLQIARQGQPMCLPEKKSIQSRFAVSVEQNIEPDKLPTKVGPVLEMFPNLRDDLKEIPGPAISHNERLISGLTVLEWVFGDATVRLSDKIEGKFALSLWYFVDSKKTDDSVAKIEQGKLDARILEISFDVKLKDGPMPARAAQRALNLFSAMQEKLPVNPKDTSKTALASPCKT